MASSGSQGSTSAAAAAGGAQASGMPSAAGPSNESTPLTPQAPSAPAPTLASGPTASPASRTPPGWPRLRLGKDVYRDLRPPAVPYTLAPKLAQRPTPTPALYTPWTPTRALQRRGHITRRMRFLMEVLEGEQVQRVDGARPVPAFRAGDVLEVRVMVPEAERKVVLYRGVCIARYDKGLRSTFKLYNVYPDAGGVVQHFPLYMPDLLGIKVVGRVPARQERLFYLLQDETSKHTYQSYPVNVPAAK